jgi:hypothetical protein
MTTQVFTATAGQTTFTVAGGYTAGQIQVLRNGVQLVVGVDVTATNGTTFVLTNAATVGDTLVSIIYTSFIVANAVAKSGDTMTGNLNITGGTLQIGGSQAVNGPAFGAYANASTSLTSGVQTKLAFQAEIFDTANCFDSTTNYRFTPNVAGYYQISGTYVVLGGTTINAIAVYKNGASYASTQVPQTANGGAPCVSVVVYMNGTTDYVELYALQLSGGTLSTFISGQVYQWFSGSMIRGA